MNFFSEILPVSLNPELDLEFETYESGSMRTIGYGSTRSEFTAAESSMHITQLSAIDKFDRGTFVSSERKDWQNIYIAPVHTVGTYKLPCRNIGFCPTVCYLGDFPIPRH